MTCAHETFEASVDVARITHDEGEQPYRFAADIHIRCAVCGLPFRFICPDVGLLHDRPTVSAVTATELRVPIEPTGPVDWNA